MTEPEKLARRVATLMRCSRADAENYIAGGWVTVDGRVVELPQHLVTTEEIAVDPAAKPVPPEPVTLLLHQPAGLSSADVERLVTAANRAPDDASGVRLLRRHFHRLLPLLPLAADESGLAVFSQDERVQRRLWDDGRQIEQEYLVEVTGEIVPYGLGRLRHGLSYGGRALAPCKVSWQNEVRLRFALKNPQPGQLRDMCAQVGLEAIAIRRLRIGTVAMGKIAPGTWRYLPAGVRF